VSVVFVDDPVVLAIVSACSLVLGGLLGLWVGRIWGVRRMLQSVLRDAEVTARIDSPTGLWNRLGFEERYITARDGRRKCDWPVSVLFVDIDNFKAVNDTHGHPTGDLVLGCVAHLIGESFREHDTVARMGGDEFAVMLLGATLSESIEVAERVRHDVSSMSVPTEAEDWSGTVSIGVIEITRGEELESALKRVDLALYAAKHAGRNRVEAN
jgi:diguanylate cyclase (GGDEF)-like protein